VYFLEYNKNKVKIVPTTEMSLAVQSVVASTLSPGTSVHAVSGSLLDFTETADSCVNGYEVKLDILTFMTRQRTTGAISGAATTLGWRGGATVCTSDLRGRGSHTWSGCSCIQLMASCSHPCDPVTASSITWYRSTGGDGLPAAGEG